MRLLVVTHYYPQHRSGVEIIAGQLTERFARAGMEVVWAASKPEEPLAPGEAQALPMTVWNFTERFLGFPWPVWGPLSLLRLGRAVRQCDVLHLHDCLYLGNLVAFLWARCLGKPIVVTQHIGLVPYSKRVLRWLMQTANSILGRLVLGGCEQVVFYAPHVRDYFSFIRYRNPPLLIPNGVDRSLFRPLPPEDRARLRQQLGWGARPVMLFVGRFVEKKGLGRLRLLAQQFPECDWVCVGWGPETPDRWGLAQVSCRGPLAQEALPPLYQAADLLVLPSVGEGFPLVVQEAMACGLPALISTETAGGCPDIDNAALVTDLDEASLARCIREVTQDPDRLTTLRETVVTFAQSHWDWEECARAYIEIFSRALPAASPEC